MTTTETPTTPLVGNLKSFTLQDKMVLLLLTLNAPGNERTIRNKDILRTDADKSRLSVSKRLLDCGEQQKIAILDGQIRDYVKRVALPLPFKAGTHGVALAMLEKVDVQLVAYAEERRELVAAFKAVYNDAKEAARAQLGDVFNEAEYLTPDELEASYRMTWQYVMLTPPDKLREANEAIFLREKQRLEEQWKSAVDDMQEALRVGLSELVTDMVTRLSGDDKKFKPTKLLERFDEFLSTFDARNVTNDEELKALADQARALLAGVDTDTLKKSKEVREQVKSGLAAAQATLTQLETVRKNQRRITFEEE